MKQWCDLSGAVALALFIAPVVSGAEDFYPWMVPKSVQKCLQASQQLAVTPIEVNREVNPFYIRGDFDGDGRLDLAVAVRTPGKDNRSVLICSGEKPLALLGNSAKRRVDLGDAGDEIVSLGWSVVGLQDVLTELGANNPRRHNGFRSALAAVRGEMILMPAEDRLGLIFHDGRGFHWYTINAVWRKQDLPAQR